MTIYADPTKQGRFAIDLPGCQLRGNFLTIHRAMIPDENTAKRFKNLVVFLISHIANRQFCETNCLRYQPPVPTFHYHTSYPPPQSEGLCSHANHRLVWTGGTIANPPKRALAPLQGLHTIFPSIRCLACPARSSRLFNNRRIKISLSGLSSSLVQTATHSCGYQANITNQDTAASLTSTLLPRSAVSNRLVNCLLFLLYVGDKREFVGPHRRTWADSDWYSLRS